MDILYVVLKGESRDKKLFLGTFIPYLLSYKYIIHLFFQLFFSFITYLFIFDLYFSHTFLDLIDETEQKEKVVHHDCNEYHALDC